MTMKMEESNGRWKNYSEHKSNFKRARKNPYFNFFDEIGYDDECEHLDDDKQTFAQFKSHKIACKFAN